MCALADAGLVCVMIGLARCDASARDIVIELDSRARHWTTCVQRALALSVILL